jgi:hypothetical protein
MLVATTTSSIHYLQHRTTAYITAASCASSLPKRKRNQQATSQRELISQCLMKRFSQLKIGLLVSLQGQPQAKESHFEP